jgi:hypothetical protein
MAYQVYDQPDARIVATDLPGVPEADAVLVPVEEVDHRAVASMDERPAGH